MRFLPVVLCMTVALAIQSSAIASLALSNDPLRPASLDGNNITSDSQTGLDWLDPSATLNQSFSTISGLLNTDSQYSSFRYATLAEVGVFFDHAGLSVTAFPGFTIGPLASYTPASSYFGVNHVASNARITAGLVADVIPFAGYHSSAYAIQELLNNDTVTFAQSQVDTQAIFYVGSWLVRDTPANAQ